MTKKYSVKDTTRVEREKIANDALVKASDGQYSEYHYLEKPRNKSVPRFLCQPII